MLRLPPDPPGLNLWHADEHISKSHHGVKIDVLTGVNGSAELIFGTHVLITSPGGSGVFHMAPLPPVAVEEAGYSTVFLPKGVKIAFTGTVSSCITIVRLPEGLFRHALRGIADYDSMLFRLFRDSDDLVLMHATDLLRSIALDAKPTPTDIITPLLHAIVSRVLQRVEGAPHRRHKMMSPAHLAVINRFIDDNVVRPIRLPELADLMGLSLFHFSREFKIATNSSPMRYVLERRVALSKRALTTTRPLAEVALDYGFSSQSHFTTAFRLVTGMTPSAWRSAC